MINISDDFFQNFCYSNCDLYSNQSDSEYYREFIKSLKYSDKEFVKRMLEEFEKLEKEEIENE